MNKSRANSGQTFFDLELAVSSVGAWNAQTEESRLWIKHNLLPRLGWKASYFYSEEGKREFQSWIYYFDNLLNSLGYLGDFYEPQLCFRGDTPMLRWPEAVCMTLDRKVVEASPSFFNENVGLVYSRPKNVSVDDIFVAAILDSDEIDQPPIAIVKVATDVENNAYTLAPGSTFPPSLVDNHPDRDLFIAPWRVRLPQIELVRKPFYCGATDFRLGTPTSPAVGLINFLRDRSMALGIHIPDWAKAYTGAELAMGLDPKRSLSSQLEESSPANEHLIEKVLTQISELGGGLSPLQWRFLIDTSDIRTSEEYVASVQSLLERPVPTDEFWSQIYDEILALIRLKKRGRPTGDSVLVACEYPGCWCRYVLHDSRRRLCSIHRMPQAQHKETLARMKRRERERSRDGTSAQRAKWVAEKRKQRRR